MLKINSTTFFVIPMSSITEKLDCTNGMGKMLEQKWLVKKKTLKFFNPYFLF